MDSCFMAIVNLPPRATYQEWLGDVKKNHPSLKLTAKASENRPGPKRKLVFQPSIFRCKLLVSGRVIQIHWDGSSLAPLKTNKEPENHRFERETHLNQTTFIFRFQPLVFGGNSSSKRPVFWWSWRAGQVTTKNHGNLRYTPQSYPPPQ